MRKPVRIGIGGPVGSGKTALLVALCRELGARHSLAAITNDIYTKEDAEFVMKSGAIAPDRVVGVETGGCPHTAIREDVSMNMHAVEEMAATIARAPTVTLQAAKMNLTRAWETMGFRTHQQASNDLQAVVSHTPEFRKFLKELMEQGATPRERMGEHKSDSGSED